jgi:hypothetical protein
MNKKLFLILLLSTPLIAGEESSQHLSLERKELKKVSQITTAIAVTSLLSVASTITAILLMPDNHQETLDKYVVCMFTFTQHWFKSVFS